ncbi:hypothetical protein WAF17_00645 [Bernardetia sp. ABR2-2B]|uniref:hypothetical protein n=1 Tax=Bernardetia sp. ABR2-2B TaxID=3127472 RepID=UPI0030CFFA41
MLKSIFSTIILLFISMTFVFSQSQLETLKTKEDAKKMSKEVISLFKDSKIKEAVEKMSPYWPISPAEMATFQEKTEGYMDLLGNTYGAVIGTEKIQQEKISDFALRETYVMLYQKSAIRLIFTYYKNKQGWTINSFKWDENYEELFQKE